MRSDLPMAAFQYVGTYRIVREIAQGGMGIVYLADQLGVAGFTKTVGIKTIRPEYLENGTFRDLFIGEAKLVADLVHENILQVYHLIDWGGSFAIVMEWVHGATMTDIAIRLDELGEVMPLDLAVFVVSRIARALEYAHGKRDKRGRCLNIVHRDVTPGNVYASWTGVVKLADFGVAKALDLGSDAEGGQLIVGNAPRPPCRWPCTTTPSVSTPRQLSCCARPGRWTRSRTTSSTPRAQNSGLSNWIRPSVTSALF